MPEGLQYSNVLDKLVAEKDGSALLIMRDDRPWDGSDEHIAELSRKINAYAAYVVDGFLVKEYPEFTNKRVRFELWSILHAPDAKTQQFIDRANAQLAAHQLSIKVIVIQITQTAKPWWKSWG